MLFQYIYTVNFYLLINIIKLMKFLLIIALVLLSISAKRHKHN